MPGRRASHPALMLGRLSKQSGANGKFSGFFVTINEIRSLCGRRPWRGAACRSVTWPHLQADLVWTGRQERCAVAIRPTRAR
ncbi:hypothetical protein FAGKG844_140004 [Frankia sp. AgKG'84/4]